MAWSLRKLLRVASESTMSVLHLGEATPLWGQDKRRLSVDDGQNWRRMRDQLEFTTDQDYAPTSTNRQSFASWLIYRLAPSADRTIDLSGGTFNEGGKVTVINNSTSAADLLVKLTDSITHIVNPGESWTGEYHDGAWSAPWSLPGFRNKLINGDMRIDQRNAGAAKTYTAGAGRAYGVDRWWVQCTGANMSGQRVAGSTAPFGYKLSGAINVTNIIMGQIVEAADAAPLKNRIVTVSCVLFADAQHTITWRARRAGAADDWTSPVQLGTGSIDVTAVPRRFQFFFNAGSSGDLGISIQFETGAFGAGTWLQIENAQLEEGVMASAFEARSISTEIAMCQRMFETNFPYGVAPVQASISADYASHIAVLINSNGSAGRQASIPFKVKKRVVPTITIFAPSSITSGSWGRISTGASTEDSVSPGVIKASDDSFAPYFSSGFTSAVAIVFGFWVADSEF